MRRRRSLRGYFTASGDGVRHYWSHRFILIISMRRNWVRRQDIVFRDRRKKVMTKGLSHSRVIPLNGMFPSLRRRGSLPFHIHTSVMRRPHRSSGQLSEARLIQKFSTQSLRVRRLSHLID